MRPVAFGTILKTVLVVATFAAPAHGQGGSPDPFFDGFPFERWLTDRAENARIGLSATVSRAELSFHQRLVARIALSVDGRDLQSRPRNGELIFFIQMTDAEGRRYRNHDSVDLSALGENIRNVMVECSQAVFVLPGEYRLDVAVLHTATGEHASRRSAFRVPRNGRDLLAAAWRGLPSVEFIPREELTDSWYLPRISGRLAWAASVRVPARLNILLNIAAPQDSHRTSSGDLAALIPAMKAISETGSPAISQHIEVLDLPRHRVAFEQDEVGDIDWPRLKTALGEANTASIDVRSLAERHRQAAFFVSEVRRIRRASSMPCVLLVLTPPVSFESGEENEPISNEDLPGCPVVYVRYRGLPSPIAEPFRDHFERPRRGWGVDGPHRRARLGDPVLDQLARTLQPLKPAVLDVDTPEQMTRALEVVLEAIQSAPEPESAR